MHAQAAMEFLMSYGWVILVSLIVIGSFMYLGVFNLGEDVQQSCVFPSGFTCTEYDLNSSGALFLDLGQATGRDVIVTAVGCGASNPVPIALPNPIVIVTGEHEVVSAGGVNCSGATGPVYKGRIVMEYHNYESPITRTVTADLAGYMNDDVTNWIAGRGGADLGLRYYRAVSVSTGVASNLTDFPAYFIMDTQSLISAGKMNSSCKDLRVVDYTLAGVMDYEIEANTCNTTSTVVWFRIPRTTGLAPYAAYVFYGNNSLADGQDKAGVWGGGYAHVWHMGDACDSATGSCGSFTANLINSTQGPFKTAKFYNRTTTGVGYYLSTSPATFTQPGDTISASFWGNNYGIASGYSTIYSDASQSASTAFVFFYRSGSSLVYQYANGTAYTTISRGSIFADGTQVVVGLNVNYTNKTYRIFKNGAYLDSGVKTDPMLFPGSPSRTHYVGNYGAGDNGGWNGTIDEFRVSRVWRSDDWFAAENGQTYSVGAEQSS